jgi:hypothetical protein
MSKTWRNYAIDYLEKILLEYSTLPDPKPSLKYFIRDNYPFGQRKYTPYKIWLEEVKIVFKFKLDPKYYRWWRENLYGIVSKREQQEIEGQMSLFKEEE